MKIILMRHGEAKAYKQSDKDRQLTQFGQQQAEQTASFILSNYQPDLFIVSPYIRAQQTLEFLTKKAPEVPVKTYKEFIPSGNVSQAIDILSELEYQCVCVVCHMPIVARLVSTLTADTPCVYALAEARVIETTVAMPDIGTLVDSFIPNQPV